MMFRPKILEKPELLPPYQMNARAQIFLKAPFLSFELNQTLYVR